MKNRMSQIVIFMALLLVFISRSPVEIWGHDPILLNWDRVPEFYAGAATADITPDVKARPVPLNGYGQRKGAPATGVHDPVFAKALFLESRDPSTGAASRAVIVTSDLCMVNQAMRDSILEQVADLGIDDSNLMLTASHTHSAQSAIDPRWPASLLMGKFDPELFERTNARFAQAVRKAHANLAPARFGVAQAEYPDLVRNRRVEGYSYETRRFAPDAWMKPTDSLMSVVRVTGADGSPIAALVVFGSHPTILGADNMLVSADWPGVMQRELARAIGGDVVTMFANGAEGDQAPPSIDDPDDFAWMEWYGREIAGAALPLWRKAPQLEGVSIFAASNREELPRLHIQAAWGLALPKTLTRALGTHAISVAIRVGPAAFVGLPGEPLHKVVIDIREKAQTRGVEQPVILGLANDWIGYIADPQSYEEGGYEAGATLFGKREAAVVTTSAINALNQTF